MNILKQEMELAARATTVNYHKPLWPFDYVSDKLMIGENQLSSTIMGRLTRPLKNARKLSLRKRLENFTASYGF